LLPADRSIRNDFRRWLTTSGGNWYQTAGSCFGLNNAYRLGVDTGGTDAFDNFSTLLVKGQHCPVASVTKVAGPPSSH
jgi:hypothetical protein